MLQPHDNYSCLKCHSKWMKGRRNHGSSSSRNIQWIPNMIAILEVISNGKMEMKLIFNETHLMLWTMNRICNFVLKLLFL